MSKSWLACLIVFAAVLLYFVVQELQVETRSFSIGVEVKGKTKEDIFAFVSNPMFVVSVHPLADQEQAITDLKRSKNDAGNEQFFYNYHETIPILGIYNRKAGFPCIMTVLEMNSVVEYNVSVDGGLLLVHQYWKLTDIADGSVELTDNFAVTSYRFLVRYAVNVAVNAHTTLVKKIKKKLEE